MRQKAPRHLLPLTDTELKHWRAIGRCRPTVILFPESTMWCPTNNDYTNEVTPFADKKELVADAEWLAGAPADLWCLMKRQW